MKGIPRQGITVTVEAPAAWVSANDRGGWQVHNRKIAAWRAATALLVRGKRAGQLVTPVEVVAVVHRTSNRRSDASNVGLTLKACVDGAVDAGLIPDDDDVHIRRTVIERGENRKRPALTLTIRSCTPTEETP